MASSLRAQCVAFASLPIVLMAAHPIVNAQTNDSKTEWLDARGSMLGAVVRLQDACKCAVTFESPTYAASDAVDPLPAVSEPAIARMFLIPQLRGEGGFWFTVPKAVPNRQAAAEVIEAAIVSHRLAGAPKGYVVRQSEQALHVIPEDGSTFDKVLITLDDREWTFGEIVKAVANQVSAATRVPVDYIPMSTPGFSYEWAYMLDAKLRFAAKAETATRALERLMDASGRAISWRLIYGATPRGYTLTLHFVTSDDREHAVYYRNGNRPVLNTEKWLTQPPQ